jgi:hypothetical protein
MVSELPKVAAISYRSFASFLRGARASSAVFRGPRCSQGTPTPIELPCAEKPMNASTTQGCGASFTGLRLADIVKFLALETTFCFGEQTLKTSSRHDVEVTKPSK